jgi:hypothetical protein
MDYLDNKILSDISRARNWKASIGNDNIESAMGITDTLVTVGVGYIE